MHAGPVLSPSNARQMRASGRYGSHGNQASMGHSFYSSPNGQNMIDDKAQQPQAKQAEQPITPQPILSERGKLEPISGTKARVLSVSSKYLQIELLEPTNLQNGQLVLISKHNV